jgi:hypothetical protein
MMELVTLNLYSEFVQIYGPVQVIKYAMDTLPPGEVVLRTLSKMGEEWFHLIARNCECYVIWCKTGFWMSDQVTKLAVRLAAIGGIIAVAPLICLYYSSLTS